MGAPLHITGSPQGGSRDTCGHGKAERDRTETGIQSPKWTWTLLGQRERRGANRGGVTGHFLARVSVTGGRQGTHQALKDRLADPGRGSRPACPWGRRPGAPTAWPTPELWLCVIYRGPPPSPTGTRVSRKTASRRGKRQLERLDFSGRTLRLYRSLRSRRPWRPGDQGDGRGPRGWEGADSAARSTPRPGEQGTGTKPHASQREAAAIRRLPSTRPSEGLMTN